ncbi:MFS transporter [Dactylosporangium matsuzakiense]|uniref:MFS transporter n=1 Tax=Dactylosporangium matsuzakiense TaxID=53360 RepID=A0A9W6NR28_9ACTN|nr:MFS transporter [Dactylosporangium matsuzakiense]UWZ42605.1 hypothetical protein Dmats_34295 [Dactylosporangium matsuzakiense]GLL06164.1 hypothetical protein GCM10017581_079120 [Dactylosporangium matsuzakiense]
MSVRRLLHERQCRRFFVAQTLSLLGDSALWLACGIWVKTLTGSSSAAALTFLCFTAPALLAPAAGLLVDRLPHRPQTLQGLGAIAGGLLTAAAIRRRGELPTITAGLALLAAATLLLSTAWPLSVLTGMLLAGAALTTIVIALITLLQRQAPHHLQGRVYAAFELCATAPQTAGLAAGAALITALDYRLLLLAAATGLVLATALLATRQRTPAGRPT